MRRPCPLTTSYMTKPVRAEPRIKRHRVYVSPEARVHVVFLYLFGLAGKFELLILVCVFVAQILINGLIVLHYMSPCCFLGSSNGMWSYIQTQQRTEKNPVETLICQQQSSFCSSSLWSEWIDMPNFILDLVRVHLYLPFGGIV